MKDDVLILGGKSFTNRLLTGTGKFSANTQIPKMLAASGSQMIDREHRGHPADRIQHQRRAPAAEAAFQQLVVEMAGIAPEYGVAAQKPPRNRKERIQQRDRQRHQGSGHAEESGRLLAPDRSSFQSYT